MALQISGGNNKGLQSSVDMQFIRIVYSKCQRYFQPESCFDAIAEFILQIKKCNFTSFFFNTLL